MAPAGLMEAVFALALHAVVLASLLSGTTTVTLLARETWTAHASLFAERQVEHLIDAATARAGAGPGKPLPVGEASASTVVLHADLNGDGVVDTNSSERTELEVRLSSGTRVLFHQIGRQSMRVEEHLPAPSVFRLLARDGNPAATLADTTCIEVPRVDRTIYAALAARVP